ncbi:MAG: helix-turn-helix transcriptional regulator [Spirochaetaceae bacterium]|jgi:transcriptional regulator with XRE-family HTH domain|nr:helix-turn-helix transcriptional regulator [Spirochaetaceae bacterium]
MNETRAFLSANIKAKRKKLGLTQEKLAELVDVSYQMIHDIEGCRTWVGEKTLLRLSEALEAEIYELLAPPGMDFSAPANAVRPLLVERLRAKIKADIDRRLNDFFVIQE